MSVRLARAGILAKQTVSGGGGDPVASMSGLWGLYYSDAGTSTTTDGVGVQTWNDQSGNGHHLTQADSAKRPLFKINQINGLAALLWDGSDDVLSITGLSPAPGTASGSSVSIFAVAKHTGTDGGIVSTRDNGANGWLYRFGTTGRNDYIVLGGGSKTDLVTTTDWNIVEVVRNGLDVKMGHNGTMGTTFTHTAEPTSTTRLDVGCEAPGGDPDSTPLSAYIAALAICTVGSADVDRDMLESTWGTKYGITVS